MKKILILAANPINTIRLRLDEEVREIQAALERSKDREQFEVINKWAVRVDDLRRAMLDHEPHIVHFSGHGTGVNGIELEDNLGKSQLISTQALSSLFKLFKDKTECVLLNACYSETQAEAIWEHIDCVIGMSNSIRDDAALNFAKAFYDAIGSGRDYRDAFEFGCNNIDLNSIPEASVPKIKNRVTYIPMEPNSYEAKENQSSSKSTIWNMQGAQFGGGIVNATTVTAHQIGGNITNNNYAPEQKQDLAKAATQIQQLLQQLEQSYPTTTNSEKAIVIAKAIQAIENNSTLHIQVVGVLEAGNGEELKTAINHPLAKKLVAQMDE